MKFQLKCQNVPLSKKKRNSIWQFSDTFLFYYTESSLCHLQNFLQCIKYIYLNSPPPPFSFIPPHPILIIVSTDLIVPFTDRCTEYLHHIYFPKNFPPPIGTSPQTGPILPFIFFFCKREKWHFCSFKVAMQGVSLSKLFHLLYFSPFYLSSFLMVVSTDLKILYSFLYRKCTNHIHLLTFLLLPSCMWPPLRVTCFTKYCCIFINVVFHKWEKTCYFWPLNLSNFT
jgi:hypothetical protein